MTVKELIRRLEKCDPNATVSVWDAYSDSESKDVHVSIPRDGAVFIDSVPFGREVE